MLICAAMKTARRRTSSSGRGSTPHDVLMPLPRQHNATTAAVLQPVNLGVSRAGEECCWFRLAHVRDHRRRRGKRGARPRRRLQEQLLLWRNELSCLGRGIGGCCSCVRGACCRASSAAEATGGRAHHRGVAGGIRHHDPMLLVHRRCLADLAHQLGFRPSPRGVRQAPPIHYVVRAGRIRYRHPRTFLIGHWHHRQGADPCSITTPRRPAYVISITVGGRPWERNSLPPSHPPPTPPTIPPQLVDSAPPRHRHSVHKVPFPNLTYLSASHTALRRSRSRPGGRRNDVLLVVVRLPRTRIVRRAARAPRAASDTRASNNSRSTTARRHDDPPPNVTDLQPRIPRVPLPRISRTGHATADHGDREIARLHRR